MGNIGLGGNDLPDFESFYNTSTTKITVTKFNVFPNPSLGIIQFEIVDEMYLSQIPCVNIWGQKVATDINVSQNTATIDINLQTNGVYFISIPEQKSLFVSKVIVQNQ